MSARRIRASLGIQIALLLSLMLSACGTQTLAPVACSSITNPERCIEPRLLPFEARMRDGYALPFRRWGNTEQPGIIVLGLHGFNDYSQSFQPLGAHLAEHGITTYAFDQRGFGRTRARGRWHSCEQLTADLRTLIRLLRARYPQARLILIGESMGAAVALSADAEAPLDIDGLVLIAPAVWSRASMPWYQRAALALAANTVPGLRLTGEGIAITPSDNLPMLRAKGKDPLVIKATRVEALWGITNLMDQAVAWPDAQRHRDRQPPTLILYGKRDSIIPPRAFCRFIDAVPRDAPAIQLQLYADGWHMLTRDLQGARVITDIATWLRGPTALTGGGMIESSHEPLRELCERH
ncbi:alpha/beta hydrolase [Thiorhodovibrio winogradskyi]|nr:alpha/beta hydrolase [Thiorhodovibrio winogradskyi]